MGYINKLSCECGYHIKLNIGAGRRLPDVEYINEHFSPEKLLEFNAAINAGNLGQLFYIENTMSYCKHCNEIKEGSALHFEAAGHEKTVYDLCNTCGSDLELIVNEPHCPRCGKILDMDMSAFWD